MMDFFDMVTGLRMNHNYIMPGGVWQDLPDGWQAAVEDFIAIFPGRLAEYEELLTGNPIWRQRTQGVAVISREQALALADYGPSPRAAGLAGDIRNTFTHSGPHCHTFARPTV